MALRLLGRGRVAHAGLALAGFGVLFVGLDMLQGGMGSLAARLSPADLPGAGLLGRIVLVGFGLLMTVVMQSSSAAMATTLAALAQNAVSLEQAAALVIGQNIGTAVTSAVAAFGATTAAKRTALAHVLFNVITGLVALIVLPLFLALVTEAVDAANGEGGGVDGPTALAAFHTAFNVLGVVLLLPAVGPFARLIERVVPERSRGPTRYLDKAVAAVGPVALEAARRALVELVRDAARVAGQALRGGRPTPDELASFPAHLDEVRAFLLGLGGAEQDRQEVTRLEALLHSIDHVSRFVTTVKEAPPLAPDGATPPVSECLVRVERLVGAWQHEAPPAALTAQQESEAIAGLRRAGRRQLLGDAAARRLSPEQALRDVDALLWIDRLAYHLWRAGAYLAGPNGPPVVPRSDLT